VLGVAAKGARACTPVARLEGPDIHTRGFLCSALTCPALCVPAPTGVTPGYVDDEAATAKAFRAGDGWFDTGDLGWVVPYGVPGSNMGGMVQLTGRSKDTIVLINGKNVSPQPIEDMVCASTLVKHCLLFGQDRRELVGVGKRRPDACLVPAFVCVHVRVDVCAHSCVWARACEYARMRVAVCACMCARACVCMYVCVCTCTYAQMCCCEMCVATRSVSRNQCQPSTVCACACVCEPLLVAPLLTGLLLVVKLGEDGLLLAHSPHPYPLPPGCRAHELVTVTCPYAACTPLCLCPHPGAPLPLCLIHRVPSSSLTWMRWKVCSLSGRVVAQAAAA